VKHPNIHVLKLLSEILCDGPSNHINFVQSNEMAVDACRLPLQLGAGCLNYLV